MTRAAALLACAGEATSPSVQAELQERLERAEAERAQALRLVSDLLSLVSHDLRNPLNTISIAVDELDDPGVEPEMRDSYIAMIRRSVSRSDLLIRDLVDIGRIEVGAFAVEGAPVSAERLVESACEGHGRACAEKGVELVARVGAGVELVRAERERVLQVLRLLLDNALRHTGRGGRIDLGAELDGDMVRFSVRDTGSGIAPEALPHLFDRYGTEPATGLFGRRLGLILCRGIVAAHGGRIAASSELGVGTELRFFLPVAEVE